MVLNLRIKVMILCVCVHFNKIISYIMYIIILFYVHSNKIISYIMSQLLTYENEFGKERYFI